MSDESEKRGTIDARLHPRIALATAVSLTVPGVEEFIRLVSDNISEGGIFLRTDTPLAVGTKIRLTISLPNIPALLDADGEVAWNRPASPDEPAGMGVRFVAMPDDGKALLKDDVSSKKPE
jgi:uncharacterized protein (TIGR02266 family)